MKKTLIVASLMGLMLIGTTFASNSTSVENNTMVTRAHNAGITKYSTWDSFMPNAPITREQAAKMIVMWIQGNSNLQISTADNECTFNDEAKIDASLSDWVRMSCTYNLFKGYKGNFMPNNNITVDDAMTVVQRLANQSPVVQSYLAMIKLNLGTSNLLHRGDLIRGLHALDVYVKAQASTDKANQLKAVQAKLDMEKKVWSDQNLVSYSLTQKVSCFCAPDYTRPVRYSVTNNSINTSGAHYADGSGEALSGTMVPTLHTVPQAFTIIQEAIDNKADGITVVYDTQLGYPTSINIDRSRMMADEEQYYTFSLTK